MVKPKNCSWFNPYLCWFRAGLTQILAGLIAKLFLCHAKFLQVYPPPIKHASLETLPLSSMIFPSDLRMTCVYRGYSMMFHIFLRCSYNFPIVVPWFSQQPPSGSGMSIDGRTTLQRRSRMAFPCGCTQPVAGRLGHWGKKNSTINRKIPKKENGWKKCDLPLGYLVDLISYRAVDQNLLVCSSHRYSW